MNLFINGESRNLTVDQLTLAQLLREEGYSVSDNGKVKGARMVAAVNGAVVSQQAYHSTALASGDKVDVVGVITGG